MTRTAFISGLKYNTIMKNMIDTRELREKIKENAIRLNDMEREVETKKREINQQAMELISKLKEIPNWEELVYETSRWTLQTPNFAKRCYADCDTLDNTISMYYTTHDGFDIKFLEMPLDAELDELVKDAVMKNDKLKKIQEKKKTEKELAELKRLQEKYKNHKKQ